MPSALGSLLFAHSSRRVRRRDAARDFAAMAEQIAPGQAVTCLVSTDRQLRQLNKRFRGKDYATDVLSFPSAAEGNLGDLAISLDRAAEQAAELGHSLDQELRILMLHGLLHLTGLDHEQDAGQMARAEKRWRKRLGLPAGLIERVRA